MALLLWEDGSPRQLQDGFRLLQEGPGDVLTASGLTWNRVETARAIGAGNWQVHVWIACAAGGSGNEIRVVVQRRNSAGAVQATIIDEEISVTADATAEYSTTPVDPGTVLFADGDVLLVIVADEAGAQAKTILFDGATGATGDSRLVHPAETDAMPVVVGAGMGHAAGNGFTAAGAHGRALGAGIGAGDGAGLVPTLVVGVEIPAVLVAGVGDAAGAGLASTAIIGVAVELAAGVGDGTGAGVTPAIAAGHVGDAALGDGQGAGLAASIIAGVVVPAVLPAGIGDGAGAGLVANLAAGLSLPAGIGAGSGEGLAPDHVAGAIGIALLVPNSVLGADNLQDADLAMPPVNLGDLAAEDNERDWTPVDPDLPWSARLGYATPNGPPVGEQRFEVWLSSPSGVASPVTIALYEAGVAVPGATTTVHVSGTEPELAELVFDAAVLSDPTGAGVEVRITGGG